MIGIYVLIGGGIGSFLRYITSTLISRNFGTNFPYGTITVNIVGSFIMGLLIEYFTKTLPHSNELRAFLTVGILGGFTTFSAFSLDTILLIDRGNLPIAMVYVLSSVIFSILAVFAGMSLVKLLIP
jgi:CrcB protein